MKRWLLTLLVAAAIIVSIGLLGGRGWPSFVMGAILALALWVMLFFGSYAGAGSAGAVRGRVGVAEYAVAAVVGVGLGYAMSLIADGPMWFPVGFILAGVLVPAGRLASRNGTGTKDA